MDVRLKDSVRNSEQMLASLKMQVQSLKEDALIIKQMVREIKSSVVRKYEKKEEK